MGTYWVIDEGEVDPATFFLALPRHFPEATTFYVEGTSVAPEVRECYTTFSQPDSYLARSETSWPESKKFRCTFSPELFAALAALSKRYALPELLDHFAIYRDRSSLLDWPDAFSNEIFCASSVPETQVSSLAEEFGLSYVLRTDS